MKNRSRLYFLTLLMSFQQLASAQHLIPLSLDEKINNASIIVEGKVSHKRSFWNEAHTMIYTANEVTIYKSFKGNPGTSTLELITMGGSVGRKAIHASDLLELNTNEVGLFFCNAIQSAIHAPQVGNRAYEVFGSSQGFIAYDLKSKTASTPFNKYKNIQKELYQKIQLRTGLQPTIISNQFDINATMLSPSIVNAPSIISFSPTTVNAGATLDSTNNLLTIKGSNFGDSTSAAAVIFTSANNTNFSVAATNILVRRWTSDSIVIRVPSEAGTGQIKVKNNLGEESISATSMQVRFSVQTAHFEESSPGAGDELIGESSLVNGTTGYEIHLSNNVNNGGLDFSNVTYRNAFLRALNTWRTSAGFRLNEGNATSTQTVSDDTENMLMFDNSATNLPPLPAGILATTISYYTTYAGVQNVLNDITKTGFDIIVRSSYSLGDPVSLASGPCSPLSTNVNEYDLESILLHELGHAINLAHINDPYEGTIDYGFINPDKIMNSTIHNGVKRTSLDQSALEGAIHCISGGPTDFSNYTPTLPVKMVPLTVTTETYDHCPTSFPSTATVSGTVVSMNLANATSNKNEDPSYLQVRTNGKGTSITNNAFYPVMTGVGASLSITISNYTWENVNENSCANYSSSSGSIPTRGTELAIYKTSTCPSAQNFPTPVTYQTFYDNGLISNIPNLESNTKYLIMVDGIENSKTSFDMTFTASALPIKLKTFTGNTRNDGNHLSWQIESLSNIGSIKIERSNQRGVYQEISSWSNNAIQQSQHFIDKAPANGTNTYRLAFHSLDGTVEYSHVVALQNAVKNTIRIFPNPAAESINIELNDVHSGTYVVRLRNTMGQIVQEESFSKSATALNKKIALKALTPGIYWIEIGNQVNPTLYAQSIQVQ